MASEATASRQHHDGQSVPQTAARSTADGADAVPIDGGAQSPQRRSELIPSSTKARRINGTAATVSTLSNDRPESTTKISEQVIQEATDNTSVRTMTM